MVMVQGGARNSRPQTPRSFPPPLACRPSPPQGGRSDVPSAFANRQRCRKERCGRDCQSPPLRRAVRGKSLHNADESLLALSQPSMGATSIVFAGQPQQVRKKEHRLGSKARKMQSMRVLHGPVRNRKTFPGQPCPLRGGDVRQDRGVPSLGLRVIFQLLLRRHQPRHLAVLHQLVDDRIHQRLERGVDDVF
ncbi:MAG: hypothetical protein EOS40_31800 [Mesorhizobium sp.]|nr:MAG: hypothetical protein EOQ40_32390 [Mesorhizobium sp.]RWD96671.1 MAG: hypothetical protein EOS40_31800 [Mesorhizobium sp.]TIS50398.1 MAG: hypothetical protein E5W96_08875 [Mesorhizobium sp.]